MFGDQRLARQRFMALKQKMSVTDPSWLVARSSSMLGGVSQKLS